EYKQWVEAAINDNGLRRESCWTASIAVGSRRFVEDTKDKLCLKAHGRKVEEGSDKFVLKEPIVPYNAHLSAKKDLLRHDNMYCWVET
ncbi:MAG: hypothetical protein K8F34_11575, partial [Candidatus Kuenenia stuttgartiensis]|nr:hypothetical protein [Candidatus Kuenenia stuttgartiensis]